MGSGLGPPPSAIPSSVRWWPSQISAGGIGYRADDAKRGRRWLQWVCVCVRVCVCVHLSVCLCLYLCVCVCLCVRVCLRLVLAEGVRCNMWEGMSLGLGETLKLEVFSCAWRGRVQEEDTTSPLTQIHTKTQTQVCHTDVPGMGLGDGLRLVPALGLDEFRPLGLVRFHSASSASANYGRLHWFRVFLAQTGEIGSGETSLRLGLQIVWLSRMMEGNLCSRHSSDFWIHRNLAEYSLWFTSDLTLPALLAPNPCFFLVFHPEVHGLTIPLKTWVLRVRSRLRLARGRPLERGNNLNFKDLFCLKSEWGLRLWHQIEQEFIWRLEIQGPEVLLPLDPLEPEWILVPLVELCCTGWMWLAKTGAVDWSDYLYLQRCPHPLNTEAAAPTLTNSCNTASTEPCRALSVSLSLSLSRSLARSLVRSLLSLLSSLSVSLPLFLSLSLCVSGHLFFCRLLPLFFFCSLHLSSLLPHSLILPPSSLSFTTLSPLVSSPLHFSFTTDRNTKKASLLCHFSLFFRRLQCVHDSWKLSLRSLGCYTV